MVFMKAFEKLSEKDPKLAFQFAEELINGSPSNLPFDLTSALIELFPELRPAVARISVVLPVFNEESNIEELYNRLAPVLQNVGPYEIVFVDDGSSDSSPEIILKLRQDDPSVKLLRFSRNFGHQAAISAGLEYSKGEAVVLMDSDLQDPPEILPDILEIWRSGVDVVYAVRKKRKENLVKRIAYFSFYRILQIVANIDIPLDSGDFCLLDRRVVEHLKAMPERNRFIRGLRSWVGFKQEPFYYSRDARYSGKAKYTFGKLLGLALNGIVSFSSLPLRLATYFGFLTFLGGVLYVIYAVAAYMIYQASPQGWTSLTVLFLLVGGVQLILLGAIGEYIGRMYDEVKQRPNYIIDEFYD